MNIFVSKLNITNFRNFDFSGIFLSVTPLNHGDQQLPRSHAFTRFCEKKRNLGCCRPASRRRFSFTSTARRTCARGRRTVWPARRSSTPTWPTSISCSLPSTSAARWRLCSPCGNHTSSYTGRKSFRFGLINTGSPRCPSNHHLTAHGPNHFEWL